MATTYSGYAYTNDPAHLAMEARIASKTGGVLEAETEDAYGQVGAFRPIVGMATTDFLTGALYGWEATGEGHYLTGEYRIVFE